MKKLLLIGLLCSTSAMADSDGMSPFQKFDARTLKTDSIQINWMRVDDVPATCKQMDARYGTQMQRGTPIACSFWSNDFKWCTIVTSKTPNMESLAHETRHCFQGDWHSK
jgi:hypothetical protein